MSEHAGAGGPKPPFALEKRDNAIIARWQAGMMDEDQLKLLIRAIDEAAVKDAAVTLVVLDMSGVSMMPSLALGLVVQMFNGCKAHGRRLRLAGLQPQVRQVLSITRLDRVLPLSDSVESAMKG